MPMDALALKALDELSPSQRMALLPYLQRGGLTVADPQTIQTIWMPQWVEALSRGDAPMIDQMKAQGTFDLVLACELPPDAPDLLSQVLFQERSRWVTSSPESHAAWREGVGRLIEQVSPVQGDEAALHMAHLRRLLDLGEWALATTLRGRASLDLNDFSIQEKTPLARLETQGAWAWFLAEGGDPRQRMSDGEPLWVWAARNGSIGPHRPAFFKVKGVSLKHAAPSPEALEWAHQYDPIRAQALVDQQYFDQIEDFNNTFSQRGLSDSKGQPDQSEARMALAWKKLTSRPDWAQVRHPSGVPALFAAVRRCPHLILMLQQQGVSEATWNLRKTRTEAPSLSGWTFPDWHRRVPFEGSLWDILVPSFAGLFATRLTRTLLTHVPLPDPSPDRKGWLIRHGLIYNPGLVSRMNAKEAHPSTWSSVFSKRTDLFLSGTPQDHDDLAKAIWSCGTGRGAEMVLKLSRVPDLEVSPALRGAIMAIRWQLRGQEDDPQNWVKAWLDRGVTWPSEKEATKGSMFRQLQNDAQFVALLREHALTQIPASPVNRPRRRT